MEHLINSYRNTGSLHHCYLITGDPVANHKNLVVFCEGDLETPVQGNPDTLVFETITFGITEARELVERQSRMSAKREGRKIFVIVSDFFTREAQNALLKVLEEPTAQTHFFILTPTVSGLLPTLLSRVQVVVGAPISVQIIAEKFLATNANERLNLAKSLLETDNKRAVIDLLDMLEKIIYENGGVKQNALALKNLNHFRPYLYDRGASPKLILEHLALTLPVVK